MGQLLENWISHMEMDDDIFNQSSSSFDEQEFLREILQEPDNFSPEGNDPLHKSNSSNSIMCLENNPNSLTTYYFLSFEKSNVEQITHIECSPDHNSVLGSKNRTREENIPQSTKRIRRSGAPDHIMAERKRRKELTENIIALAAIIPGLKKMDKTYVLREAVNYTKQLQERIKELEDQNKDKSVDSAIFTMKSQASSNKSIIYCETKRESLLGVKARVLEKEIHLGIHCEKQKHIVPKIYVFLEKLHLSVTSSSVLPFGTSTVIINIIAQMDNENNMSTDELEKSLREYLMEAYDMQ